MVEKPEIKIRVSPEGIPTELKGLPRWVLWKHVWVEKTQRWAKVPFQPSGRRAASDSPDTWCSFDTAMIVAHLYDGIGFVFNGDAITGIDLDGMVDDSGKLSEKANRILEQVPGYAELSPSGRGLHIITRTEPIGDGKRKGGVEAYSTGRYFTFTGHQINGHNSVPDSPQDISPFLAEHFGVAPAAEKTDLDIACAELPRTFCQKVNDLAMKAFAAWVPALFPDAIPYHKGGYRISSLSLGRPLEEDISIVPEGIKDFGVADQGDPRGGKRSPIDLVIEWGGAKDAQEAANRLCGYLDVDPIAMGGKSNSSVPSGNAFTIHEWSAYKQNYLSTPWIIKSVLPRAEVGILYGQSGSGKTFFVLDLAATVARGAPWRGRRVSECRVVYVAAEAREGIKKRMDAYDQHVCAEGKRPDIIASAPNLLSTDTKQLIEAIGSAGLIILDTMAASHSGDENSAKDMGLFLAACKDISVATGAMVLAVHHTGKEESKGMRGSSALFAGADFVMEVFKNEKEHGAMLSKSRDDVTGTSFGFVLRRVVVGHDEEGDEVTTCVVEPIQKEVSKAAKRPKKLANLGDTRYDMHREMLTIFEKMADDSLSGYVDGAAVVEAVQKKYPSKLKKNLAVVLLKLASMGAVVETPEGYRVAEDEISLG